MKPRVSNLVYQLRVTLLGSEPPIWRRILVPRNATLQRLHFIIQKAMGWETSHLHMFEVGENRYGEPNPEWGDVQDHRSARLYHCAWQAGQSFKYIYDMGDGWQHEVLIENIMEGLAEGCPLCIDGARACPPEDCGGMGGYGELLEILDNPRHERHQRMKQWLGGPFDPEAFDLQSANKSFLGGKKGKHYVNTTLPISVYS